MNGDVALVGWTWIDEKNDLANCWPKKGTWNDEGAKPMENQVLQLDVHDVALVGWIWHDEMNEVNQQPKKKTWNNEGANSEGNQVGTLAWAMKKLTLHEPRTENARIEESPEASHQETEEKKCHQGFEARQPW